MGCRERNCLYGHIRARSATDLGRIVTPFIYVLVTLCTYAFLLGLIIIPSYPTNQPRTNQKFQVSKMEVLTYFKLYVRLI